MDKVIVLVYYSDGSSTPEVYGYDLTTPKGRLLYTCKLLGCVTWGYYVKVFEQQADGSLKVVDDND